MTFIRKHWYILPAAVYLALWAWLWQHAGFESFGHAFERTYLHVFAGPAVFMGAFWGLWWLERHKVLVARGMACYVIPCIVSAMAIFFREVFDVFNGSPLPKSFLDLASWLAGTGWGAWLAYRIEPFLHEVNNEIRFDRADRKRT